jgi:hypothetical protein
MSNKKMFHLVTTHCDKLIYISSPIEKPLLDARGLVVSIEKIPGETIQFQGDHLNTDDPKLLKQLLDLNQYDQSFQFVEPKEEVEAYIEQNSGKLAKPATTEESETPEESFVGGRKPGRPAKIR